MKNKNTKNKIKANFITKLFIFFIILPIFIFSVTTITTNYYISLLKKKIEEKYITSLKIIRSVIDDELFNVYRTLESYCWTKNINRLRNSNDPLHDFPYGYPFSYLDILKEYNIHTLIHSIYYIHIKSKTVIGSNRSYREKNFFNIYYPDIKKTDIKYYFDDLNEILPSVTKLKYKNDYINVIPILMKDKCNEKNLILINISEQKLFDTINKYIPEAESDLFIIDSEGFIRSSTIREKNIQENIFKDKKFIKLINTKRSFSYKFLNNKDFIIKAESARSNSFKQLYYMFTIPYDRLYKQSSFIRNVSLLIIILTLIYSLIIALFMNKYLFSPIKKILLMFKNTDKEIEFKDEFSFISNNIQSLLSEKERLTKKMTKNLPIIYENHLFNLLHNKGFKEDKIKDIFNMKNISFKHPNFIVIVTRVIFTGQFYETFNREEQLNILNNIYKLAKNAFPPIYNVFILTITQNEFCIILNLPDITSNDDIIKSIRRIHRVYDIKQYYLNIYSGIGRIYFGLKGLKESFDEAYIALSSISPIIDNQIKEYKDDSLKDNIYTIKIENQLKNQLLNGNKEKTLKLIDSIINNEEFIASSIEMKKKILKKIYDLCKTVTASININEREIMNGDYMDIEKTDNNIFKDYLIKLFIKITEKIPKNHKRKINLTEIMDYINKNYTADISLEIIADDYQVSRHYLSRVIRDSLNMTFQQYLNNLRINKSKVLLRDTKKSVNKICSECGYNSRFSFIRMFKKNEGITPSEYRYIENQKKIKKKVIA